MVGMSAQHSAGCRPLDKVGGGGGRSPKKIFSALRASVWSKNKGGEGGLSPSPGPATGAWTGNDGKEKGGEGFFSPSQHSFHSHFCE